VVWEFYCGGQEGCPPGLVLDRKKGERPVYVGILVKRTIVARFQRRGYQVLRDSQGAEPSFQTLAVFPYVFQDTERFEAVGEFISPVYNLALPFEHL